MHSPLEFKLKGLNLHFYFSVCSLFQCLFDTIINTQLTQVIIPFDASSDPKDIKDHVMSTISRVVAKVSRSIFIAINLLLMIFRGQRNLY